jgi:hypothetical protein
VGKTVDVTLEPQGGAPDDSSTPDNSGVPDSSGVPDNIRISDAERAQVVDRLRRHCAEGRITLDEFSDRAGQVYASRTRAELLAVLADLPEPVPIPSADGAPVRRQTTNLVVGIMGGGHSKGRWRPDNDMTALAIMGGCTVDLRQAEIEGPVIDISAIAIMGGVEVIVPEGIAVELSGIAIMGGKDCRVKGRDAVAGNAARSRQGVRAVGWRHSAHQARATS